MEKQEVRQNGTYRVLFYNKSGIAIVPRRAEELFPIAMDDPSKVNVLFYMDEPTLDSENSDKYLAYSLASTPGFHVGITTHADLEPAKNANIVITGKGFSDNYNLHSALTSYNGSNRVVFDGARQKQRFKGKRLGQIVQEIEEEFCVK